MYWRYLFQSMEGAILVIAAYSLFNAKKKGEIICKVIWLIACIFAVFISPIWYVN